jgi:hypothetical protein
MPLNPTRLVRLCALLATVVALVAVGAGAAQAVTSSSPLPGASADIFPAKLAPSSKICSTLHAPYPAGDGDAAACGSVVPLAASTIP